MQKLLLFFFVWIAMGQTAAHVVIPVSVNRVEILCQEEVILGDPVKISVRGLRPHSQATLSSEFVGSSGRIWRSSADFIASGRGVIDLAKQAPTKGSYSGIDPLGIFWSMEDTKEVSKDTSLFETEMANVITLRVISNGQTLAERRQKRWWRTPGVIATKIRERGLVATFFQPPGKTPMPGIILIGGSGGGISWQSQMGGLLASHGYATLALAYFGMEGVPQNLEQIPLEYFQTAISWLAERPSVDRSRLSVFGESKGAEIALLLASRSPQIKAVIAGKPSSVVFQGFPPKSPATSSWSFMGNPLPFVPYRTSEKYQKSRKLADLYASSLEDQEAFKRAVIPVENIKCPVLLVSGRADALWPSAFMGDQIIERLRQHSFRYPFKHVSYEDAGHSISRPGYMPTADTLRNGGTLQGNARAQVEGWQELLGFLHRSLKR